MLQFLVLGPGCKPPGAWEGLNFWQQWILNFFPRFSDSLCRGMGGNNPSGGLPHWAIFLVLGAVGAVIVVNLVVLAVPFVVFVERRVLGRFQQRIGPNRVGPGGLLQPLADSIKLMTKEDITPFKGDHIVHALAPVAFIVPMLLMFAVMPWGKGAIFSDLNIGILYVIAMTTSGIFGVFMIGWASNNKYSLFGAMRAIAQLVSYEVPMVLSIVGVVLMAGSLQMSHIIENQAYIPNILFQPLGFLIFVIACSAELNRSPFDLLEAESELGGGFHTEYSGLKWGMIQLAEYAALIGYSGIISALFLSGWKGPVLPSYLWFVAKLVFVMILFMWTRATLPRVRIDQVMGFGWKFLLPLALVNIFVTGGEIVLFGKFSDPATVAAAGRIMEPLPAWLVPVNFIIAGLTIVIAVKLLRFPGKTRQVMPQAAGVSAPQVAPQPASRGS